MRCSNWVELPAMVLYGIALERVQHPLAEQDLRVAQDGIERRADLVAHVRQEGGLRPVRGFRLHLRAVANRDFGLQCVVGRGQLGGALADARLEIVSRRPQLLLRTRAFANLRGELGGRFPDALLRGKAGAGRDSRGMPKEGW